MHKYLILIIILCLIGTPFCQTVYAETLEWKETVAIEDQTNIAEGDLLKVKAGTQIKLTNLKSKLNIMGELRVNGSEKKPATIVIPNLLNNASTTSIQEKSLIITNSNLKELEIHPYSVDTGEIVDELKAFRKQYAFVWVVLMGIQIYLVLNRTTYW
jgi:hypothetical protein